MGQVAGTPSMVTVAPGGRLETVTAISRGASAGAVVGSVALSRAGAGTLASAAAVAGAGSVALVEPAEGDEAILITTATATTASAAPAAASQSDRRARGPTSCSTALLPR